MSLNSNMLQKAINSSQLKSDSNLRLAKVIEINNGSYKLQFAGEEEARVKEYKVASACGAKVGSTVIVAFINNSATIIGTTNSSEDSIIEEIGKKLSDTGIQGPK